MVTSWMSASGVYAHQVRDCIEFTLSAQIAGFGGSIHCAPHLQNYSSSVDMYGLSGHFL